MSIVIVGGGVRVAPPLHVLESSGIRATRLLLQPISWTSSQGDTRRMKPAGGRGTQAEHHNQPEAAADRTGGHGVAAPCPWAQNTPLPSQSQTFWARWRTATGGLEVWITHRGASGPRWAPTGSRRSPSPVCSISTSRSSINRLISTTITIITTTTTYPPPLHPHPPPLPQPPQPQLWEPAGRITCPTGCHSSPGPSVGSATAASGTSETCRPTRRRWGAEGRRRRGTATRSQDTRPVRGDSIKSLIFCVRNVCCFYAQRKILKANCCTKCDFIINVL